MAPEIVSEDHEKNPMNGTRNHSGRTTYVWQSILRLVAIVATAVSLVIVLTSKQEVVFIGIPLKAQYSYSPAFKFLAAADGIVCGVSVLTLVMAGLLGSGSKPRSNFSVFLIDLVMMGLMISACSVAIREGFIAKYGAEHMGWMALCDKVPKFCNKVTASIALSSLSFIVYLILTIISAGKLMPAPVE